VLTIDEAFLPATLTAPPMTDAEFAEFCSEHPDLCFEMTAEGELIVMPPTFTKTGFRNRSIIVQLDRWAEQDERGMVGGASQGSFFQTARGGRRTLPGRRRA
jgi:Uma2 family endonuclease